MMCHQQSVHIVHLGSLLTPCHCTVLQKPYFFVKLFLCSRNSGPRLYVGMSGPERDDLMDFFDLSKPFKRVNLSQHTGEWQLAQRARQGQRAVREGLLAPAPDQSQEKEAETAEGEWELYQKEVISRLHEQAAASSHANNVVEQSVHPSCMSGAEADTFVDSLSVVPTPAAAPQGREVGRKGIAEAFNMKKHCEETWRLPIHDSKQDILDKVAANQVVVMSGPTGCGKSTQVPQYILDQHAEQRKTVNIVVTQPRKLAASSMARRVCKERGWHLGGLVGYQVSRYLRPWVLKHDVQGGTGQG